MNVPKLRFKEFSDKWLLLKETIKILSGNMYPLSAYNNTGVLLIQGLNIYPKKLKLDKPIYISNEFNAVKHLIIQKNDILIGLNRPIIDNELKICKFMYDYAYLYQRAGVLSFNKEKINTDCLYQYLQSDQFIKNLSTELVGSDQPYIKSNLFNVVKIYFPKLEEQNKIANFLTTVDKKITNLENTITSLENQKKGLLQQIFSQKLRFKDKNGNNYPNWINSTIGNSGYFYYGKSAPKWSITDTATIPCIRYGELYTTHNIMVKKIYSYTNIPKENLKFSKGNEVLVPRVGEEPLDFCKCCYLPFKDVAIGEMISVYNTKNNPLFISYLFNATMKYKFAKLVEGGNVSNLYYSYLENIKIKLPCFEEQTKIADFLSAFDRKLENQKAQLEHWKQIKKGLLQQMFV